VFAAVALALFASAASGQTIYRCGASYSQSPCANATVRETVAPPTDAQRAEARSVPARETLLALAMVQDRRERVSAMRPATAGSLGPLAAARPASAPAAPK